MEANVQKSNKPVEQSIQDVSLSSIEQQLKYPLDYVTQEILKQFINTAYPVGSIYMNTTNSANPSIILGVGTWSAIEGYVIAGYKSGDTNFGTVGTTVGSATHTLTIDEIPAHTHGANNLGSDPGSWGIAPGMSYGTVSDSTGGGMEHNNIQPTLVAYVWKRIS